MKARHFALTSVMALAPLAFGTAARAQTAGAPGSTPDAPDAAVGTPTQATPQTNTGIAGSTPGDAATASEPGPQASTGVAEIIVTAQRRSESVQKVPITIAAVSGEQLAQSNVRSIQDLTTLVAGFTGPGDIAFSSPHLRGVGSQISSPGLESSVATYVDGVYIGAISPALLRLTNVAQVEVLKGPQGTLFGRNTTGGIIQITTREPNQEFEADVEASYANYQTISGSAYLNLPVNESVSTNLAVQGIHAGKGFGTNLATGSPTYQLKRDIAVRNKWNIDLGPDTRLQLMGDYEDHSDLNYFLSRSLAGTVVAPGYVSTVDGWDANSSDVRVRSEAYGLTGRLSHDFGFATLSNTLAYRHTTFDILGFTSNYAPPEFADLRFFWYTTNKQLTDELQLASNGSGPLKWTVGLFYYNAVDLNNQPAEAGPQGPPFDFVTISRLKTTSIAGYAQGSYELTPKTTLTLGIRYSRDRHSVNGTFTHSPDFFDFLDQTSTVRPFSKGAVALRASLAQEVGPALVYASFNRGTKSGGFNPVQINNPPFDDERLDAYEIGVKSDLLDRKLRLNLAGFYYDYSNIQVQSFKNAGPPTVYNASSAKLYGLDAEVDIRPTQALSIRGTASYVHSEFGDFPTAEFYAPCDPSRVATGQCSPANGAAGAGYYIFNANAKGFELPRAPKYTASASVNYTIPVAFGKFDLNTTYNYNGGFFTTVGHELRQKAFNRVSASIQFTNPDDSLYVRLFGSNLTNSKDVQGLDINQAGPVVKLNAPRQYGLTVGMKFK